MKRNIRITVIVCLVWVALVLGITYNRYAGDNTPVDEREVAVSRDAAEDVAMSGGQLREIGARLYDEPVPLEGFRLRDSRGGPFTREDLEGQWSLLFFGFTNCPDMCPVTMQELGGFYRELQDTPWAADTRVVFISVDPARDDPEQAGEYARNFHEDFLGLTGEHEQLASLSEQLYIPHSPPTEAQRESGDYEVDHSGNILLIDADGNYRGFLEAGIQSDNLLRAYQQIRSQH